MTNDEQDGAAKSRARKRLWPLVLLPVLVSPLLPYFRPSGATTSLATGAAALNGQSVFTNFVIYGGVLFALFAAGAWWYRARWPDAASAPVDPLTPPGSSDSLTRMMLVAAALAVAATAIRTSFLDPGSPLTDHFHEGEYTGFLPAFRELGFAAGSFLIHGFGSNVLPSIVADAISPAHVFAGARLFRVLLGWIAWAGFALVLRETIVRRSWKVPAGRVVAGLWVAACLLEGVTYRLGSLEVHTPFREALVLPQLATLLWYFRLESSRARWFVAVLLGASLPIALLHNYGEAATALMVMAAACVLAPVIGRSIAAPLWIGMPLGLFSCAGLLALSPASRLLPDALEHVRYWASFGRSMWFVAMGAPGPGWILGTRFLWFFVGVQVAALLLLVHRWRGHRSVAKTIAREVDVVLLLVATGGGLRHWVDRADSLHWGLGGITAVLLCGAVVASIGAARVASIDDDTGRSGRAWLVAFAASVGLLIGPPPVLAATVVDQLRRARVPDLEIFSPLVRGVAGRIKEEAARARCFYTLTSEGIWYPVLGLPSCSRFHQLSYARSESAQREVIDALSRTPPALLLFEDPFWSARIDGVSVGNANPLVLQHVLERFRPGPMVDDHWFWRPAATPVTRRGSEATGVPFERVGQAPGEIVLRGPGVPGAAYVVSDGVDGPLLAAAQVGSSASFEFVVPVHHLSRGLHRFVVWTYDAADDALVKAGSVEVIR